MKNGATMVALLAMVGTTACTVSMSPIPDEKNDVLQYVQIAPVSLPQAAVIAADHTVGKAIRAALVRQSSQMIYEVLVLAGTKLLLVKVDPVNAKVLEVIPQGR